VSIDSTNTKWRAGSATNAKISVLFEPDSLANVRRPGYPYPISIVFSDAIVDTSTQLPPVLATPARFHVFARTPSGDVRMKFRFKDNAPKDGTLSDSTEYIELFTYTPSDHPTSPRPTFRFKLTNTAGLVKPRAGDVFDLALNVPANGEDLYTFVTGAQQIDRARALVDWSQKPYVVPNPYVGAASFEPQRYASSGRGDRRIEFRSIPTGAVIRIYTVHGDLVQTLRQDGSINGMVPWDLRTRDNLDVAPGLYIFQVDAPGIGTSVGKFAVIK
jgi:hypothetical protein